ncbi:MAG: glycosyltransferase family 4 protein [Vicinamibacterales bacterium]
MSSHASSDTPPPRVVILSTYYFPVLGGVESHARSLAAILRDRGADVWVLTKRMSAETPDREVVDDVPVVRVGPRGPRRGGAKWLMIPALVRALVRWRNRYDVVVCPDFRGVGLAALFARMLTGRPVVFEAATPGAVTCANWDETLVRSGVDPASRLGRALKWPGRAAYGAADAYACISREIEREVAETWGPSLATFLPYAVDLAAFQPPTPAQRARARDALGLATDTKAVAFIGRLSEEKGIVDLMHAWDDVRHDNATLLVVGPEMTGHPLDAGPTVRAMAERMLPDRVRLLGPARDVRPFLSAADVFVQPSHYEALGLSAVEALATGLPVVASRVGGLGEFLEHERNALLCPPRDPAALSVAISRVLEEPSLAVALSLEGRRTAERLFAQERIADRWVALLGGLVQLLLSALGESDIVGAVAETAAILL